MEEAMKNDTIRGYLTSAQAMADYAEILIYIKDKLSAHNSPIIVIGGSYGGMLASWFRLKYPHIALGALASSAPILYFDDITPQNGYFSIVTKDFKEVSHTCYETIRESWSQIEKVASKPNGLSILSRKFKLCSQLKSSKELKFYLERMYSGAAQYNHPPNYPVTLVCNGIDGAPNATDIIGRIFAGVVSYRGKQKCYDTNATSYTIDTRLGWKWQTCSEMVIPIGRGSNDTMFPSAPFNLSKFSEDCKSSYGVSPRPHWVTAYYGGHNIKLVLHRFASNIIFSNGLRDPYSSGGQITGC
ncbi:lysosomal Pro-X carboxypeptidase-like isoform X2 [Olea europaea var. sylvestris]|uniref:lysosomal Pro-X carboxypeptidase-like isoform X2 n=1 Tax=Olea europaea var. sylvestris TaxID=158386 RepID=UPI000C1D0DFB|nr:lysosomal Pro-X carboxypeptidase-like isoform X2 [Olea europaea var. sylvestris]